MLIKYVDPNITDIRIQSSVENKNISGLSDYKKYQWFTTIWDFFDQIPPDEQANSVYTDGAYETKYHRQVISNRHAHAMIPPKKV